MAEISKDERNSVVHAKDLPMPTSPIDVRSIIKSPFYAAYSLGGKDRGLLATLKSRFQIGISRVDGHASFERPGGGRPCLSLHRSDAAAEVLWKAVGDTSGNTEPIPLEHGSREKSGSRSL